MQSFFQGYVPRGPPSGDSKSHVPLPILFFSALQGPQPREIPTYDHSEQEVDKIKSCVDLNISAKLVLFSSSELFFWQWLLILALEQGEGAAGHTVPLLSAAPSDVQ